MGHTKQYPPCVQMIAAFSQHADALDWLWSRVGVQIGPVVLLSPLFEFNESAYYRPTMGERLLKQFAVLQDFYDPARLARDKLTTNAWENEFKDGSNFEEQRPLNIDPGYISMTKLVLASTKNREHRVYLCDGIYAEVTLAFRNQEWQPMSWTYPDYQREDFRVFFHQARRFLTQQVALTSRQTNSTPLADSANE